jgi:ABC-type bacteriocin/lantibiotic exporter with double-glycine peptidase domain
LSNISSVLGHVVILYFGGLEVFKGNMTIGTLIALNSIIALLYAPIERIVNFNRLLQVFKIESQKLNDFLTNNTLIIDVKNNEDYLEHSNSKNKDVMLEMNNISFSYDKLKVLENINIEIDKGQFYAIVGENGSGKSTLINLITGLLTPNKGNIFFNGTNIHQFLDNFRKKLGYVHQDTFLLHDSILNNITFGRKTDSKYSVDKLLNICEVDFFMNSNSLSMNTIIGENGSKLSGGQKQKIALCRALYNNPDLLIIDEGTSNIDSDSEKRIIENIRKNFPDITIIIISHRLSTIKLANYVFVLKDSCMVEKYAINESENKNSIFYKLFSNQFE